MRTTFLNALVIFVLFKGMMLPAFGCTIFVLTDAKQTLFFNNEDYSNPATRIWFVPGGKNYYGAAYVGFDDDWAQGGVNTAGLAFDWVAGFQENYIPADSLQPVRGNNPGQRMLESCATVDDAIGFYKKYKEPGFSYAKIMIADKTGASVIIGVKNGRLHFDRSNRSRGFGYGEKALLPMLAERPEATYARGLPILQACAQEGQFATKYSTVYDLRSGDITLLPSGQNESTTLNIDRELAKGPHYYDMPQITTQLTSIIRPLRPGMKRFLSDGYAPVAGADTAMNEKIKTLLIDAASGDLHADQFSPELWAQIAPNLEDIQGEYKKTGRLESLTLVERSELNRQRSYLYLIEFEKASVLQRFVLDNQDRVAGLMSEGSQLKAR